MGISSWFAVRTGRLSPSTRRVVSSRRSGAEERALASGSNPNAVALGAGDTLYVYDRRLSRLSVLTPDWRFVRASPVPHGLNGLVRTNDGAFVLSGDMHDGSGRGHPLHVFAAAGSHLRSFGERDRVTVPNYPVLLSRWLAPAPDGGFWGLTVVGEYVVEHWSTAGQLMESFVREPVWFPRSEPPFTFTGERPPTPSTRSVVADQDGRLWTVSRVAAARWADGIQRDVDPRNEAAVASMVLDEERVWDTIVEVIDVWSGTLIASERFDAASLRFVAPGLLYSLHIDAAGRSIVEMKGVSLVRPGT